MSPRKKKAKTENINQAPSNGAGVPVAGLLTTMVAQPTLPEFTKITGNIKGKVDVDITQRTAVVGKSRKGKTAILDAFRVGLTAKHPVGPHGVDLMELAPDGAAGMDVMLISQAGSSQFSFTKGSAPPDKPEFFGAYKALDDDGLRLRALPTTLMKHLLVGDRKAREAIFTRFGQGVAVDLGAPSGCSAEQTELWNQAIAQIMGPAPSGQGLSDPAEVLAEMNGWMRRAKLAAGKDARAAEDQLDKAKQAAAAALAGSELLPQLEEQYKQALAFEAGSRNVGTSQAQLDAALQELQTYEAAAQLFIQAQPIFETEQAQRQATVATLRSEIGQLKAQLPELEGVWKASEERLQRVASISKVLDAMVAAGVNECPLCHTGNVSPAHLKTEIERLVVERREMHSGIEQQLNTTRQEIANRERQLKSTEEKFASEAAERERARNTIKTGAANVQSRIEGLRSMITAVVGNYAGPPSADVKHSIDVIHGANAVRAQVSTLEEQIRQHNTKQANAKILEKEAETKLQSLLNSVLGTAEGAVNKYMPSGYVAKLDLSGGGCEWRVIGDDGRPHNKHTISGSEKASLLIALALAWTEGAPFRALTLDDDDLGPFHADPDVLKALLAKIDECCANGLIQQVLTSGLRKEEVPPGWTVIQR